MRSSFGRAAAVLLSIGLLASACGDEPADYDALIRTLTQQAELSEGEATCVADEIFLNSGLTESEINNGADDLTKSKAFSDAFDAALALCADL